MKKNILVINGNPKSDSFCKQLAETYAMSGRKKNDIILFHLNDLQFNPDLSEGYQGENYLEKDLIKFQDALAWSEHVVLIFPIWWGGMPAKLKGLIDRTFLPDFAFKYKTDKTFPEKLFKGKTYDLILTMDTPPFYYRWFQGNSAVKQIKRTIFGFCGFKSISTTYIGPVLNSSPVKKAGWLKNVSEIAKKNNAAG